MQVAGLSEREFALKQQQVIAPIVVDGGIAALAGAGQGEGDVERADAPAPAQKAVGNAVAAGGGLTRPAGILRRATGLNVDDRRQRVGTVGRGAGTADDLDPFDVLQGNGQVVPIDPAARILKDTLAVDQDQHPAGELVRQAVIGDGRLVVVFVADLDAGHQPQDLGQPAGARGLDHRPVDDRHRIGRFVEALGQPRGGQHPRRIPLFRRVAIAERTGFGAAAGTGSERGQRQNV